MFKSLLAAAVFAAVIAGPAHADLRWNGPILQGTKINGTHVNGPILQGAKFNGIRLNGPSAPGLNSGGRQDTGLNGQVIAIEF